MADIICSGFGGQGVLTAGLIMINAGADIDKHVSWSPSYGSEMRGGTANCNIVISDEEVGSPYPNKIDILIAMNEPSVDKFMSKLRPGGKMFVNNSILHEDKVLREDIEVYFVDASTIASDLENKRGANIVMLGAMVKGTDLYEKDKFAESLKKYFEEKGKHNPRNIDCFTAGYEKVTRR